MKEEGERKVMAEVEKWYELEGRKEHYKRAVTPFYLRIYCIIFIV